MAKAYSSVWLVLVIITLALMVALYTRVVNALWCKQDNSPTNIQKVSAHKKKNNFVYTCFFGSKAQSPKPKAQSPKPKAQSLPMARILTCPAPEYHPACYFL